MLESSDDESDEPLTPTGRVFLQPKINLVINCALIAEDPIRNLETFKAELESSIMLKHPRFCSLMVTDSDGHQQWKRTKVNVDRHLIIRHEPITVSAIHDDLNISDEDILNDYLGELSYSSPLSTDKPLWEIHVLVAHKAAIFRVHHALGDGISLMSMLLSSCRWVEDPDQTPRIGGLGGRPSWMTRQGWSIGALVKVVLYTLIQFLEILLRVFWVKDEKTILSGGDGVEFWPRKLVTARFLLDDMKVVKSAVDGSSINDVLFGIISSGLSRYLDIRSPKAPHDGLQITGAAMFNVRPESGLQDMSKLIWGNRFGMLVLPVYYQKPGQTHPLHFVKRAKAMIDKRKMSLMIPLWYLFGNLVITLFGPKLASEINYRVLSNTTFTITNMVGPQEKISLIGNPVKHIRGLTSSLPHALTLAMVSYAGEAELQISVAKDIISDPKVLAKCFEDALLEMKEAAAQATIIGS